jgi:hypothetical protein
LVLELRFDANWTKLFGAISFKLGKGWICHTSLPAFETPARILQVNVRWVTGVRVAARSTVLMTNNTRMTGFPDGEKVGPRDW